MKRNQIFIDLIFFPIEQFAAGEMLSNNHAQLHRTNEIDFDPDFMLNDLDDLFSDSIKFEPAENMTKVGMTIIFIVFLCSISFNIFILNRNHSQQHQVY